MIISIFIKGSDKMNKLLLDKFKILINSSSKIIPDNIYLKLRYKYYTGKKLNLKNPQTFSEKLQWLKLYDRNPLYTKLVDKYEVRKYIAETIGKEYLIPLIGVYNNIEEIDWKSLPNQFVLKCTHGSRANIVCSDKSKLDVEDAKNKLKKWIKRNWFWFGREWPYKNVKPRIICEKYIKQENSTSLIDYKFYCFNGEPVYCQVIKDRDTEETIDFFDMDWNLMKFTRLHKPNSPFPHSKTEIKKPLNFEVMKKISKILSKNIPFVRIDLYSIDEKIYFGEITFYPFAGFGEFDPPEWNKKLGDLIVLPQNKKEVY